MSGAKSHVLKELSDTTKEFTEKLAIRDPAPSGKPCPPAARPGMSGPHRLGSSAGELGEFEGGPDLRNLAAEHFHDLETEH